ncbi:hypothetical protein [Paraburkholderia rhynchosiae]|uniref:Uncharacterized protein n=1 Tax=Paraburkholderia rhynchosiae TaxID=487049 RepID=A0A2N7WD30_9BURK|nr:hypothetical protein [Paraburkholderia rhynchosiae]PMS27308.1 hypothetical protein C0Z16_25110 [Paraburkholderia rhynchosiae]CAB3744289.1 hypothetical protein LMG27174_07150 [Paraburkholderia rhynchosiae]
MKHIPKLIFAAAIATFIDALYVMQSSTIYQSGVTAAGIVEFSACLFIASIAAKYLFCRTSA